MNILQMARPDGLREGLHMEQLGGVSSLPGQWHAVEVRLRVRSLCSTVQALHTRFH
jgi:hypothetical protein